MWSRGEGGRARRPGDNISKPGFYTVLTTPAPSSMTPDPPPPRLLPTHNFPVAAARLVAGGIGRGWMGVRMCSRGSGMTRSGIRSAADSMPAEDCAYAPIAAQ
jgi:hypothetical protein